MLSMGKPSVNSFDADFILLFSKKDKYKLLNYRSKHVVVNVKGRYRVCCQFYPDGSAVDLLSYNRENLKPVTHPVLGRSDEVP